MLLFNRGKVMHELWRTIRAFNAVFWVFIVIPLVIAIGIMVTEGIVAVHFLAKFW